MKNKLSPSRFYLSNIIFYTYLLAFPLSAAIEQGNKTESSQPRKIIDSVDAWFGMDGESSDQEEEKNQEKEWFNAVKKNDLKELKNLFKPSQIKEVTDNNGNNALHLACLFSGSVDIVTWLLDECKIGLERKGQYQNTPFLCAAEKGQLKVAMMLKQRGANINAKDENGSNALHLACLCSGSVDMVTWLLDECNIGLETKEHNQNQKTPFLCAAEKGQLAIAKMLKQRGANINAKDENGNNALHMACLWSRSVETTTWLLNVCKLGLETKGYAQQTPFLFATAKGNLQIAKLLKAWNANINAKDESGNNALHKACLWSRSVKTTTWLLDVCKIDIETKGNGQQTPFIFATAKGNLQIAKLLRERGANIHAKDKYGDNALHYACLFSGSVPMVNWLLDVCKISIETKGCDQNTPFLCAANKGQVEIAKLLKQRGAYINATDRYRDNALHYTCLFSGSVPMVTWLLDVCKIGLETKGSNQKTPFLCAAYKDQVEIANLLKQRGADINAKDEYGNNALHLACSPLGSSKAMVKWLLDICKIDTETEGYAQQTPFLYAAKNGHLEIAKLLKQWGANINATDKDGNNALHLASSKNEKMKKWLSSVCKSPKSNWLSWLI